MKLSIELVPSTCWFSNVRSELSSEQWDFLRKQIYAETKYVCEVCGGKGDKHPVECHEIWKYDDKKLIQKLVGMIALCPTCHMVKHIGLASINGRGEQAVKHFMKVNKKTKKQADQYIKKAFTTWQKRSEHQWVLDISILEDYGIDIESICQKRDTKNPNQNK